jgi:hypothetical protein
MQPLGTARLDAQVLELWEMADETPQDPLFERGQQATVKFLLADLNLAFTILKTAEIDAVSDPKDSQAALTKVQEALATIRRFDVRIDDEKARNAISARADELQAAIEKFQITCRKYAHASHEPAEPWPV